MKYREENLLGETVFLIYLSPFSLHPPIQTSTNGPGVPELTLPPARDETEN